jgi:hypothetical protein
MSRSDEPRFGALDDTTPEAREVLLGLLRRMSPAERFASALAASSRLREFVYSGLRLRSPDASPEELDRMYAELILPPDVCRKFLEARRTAR